MGRGTNQTMANGQQLLFSNQSARRNAAAETDPLTELGQVAGRLLRKRRALAQADGKNQAEMTRSLAATEAVYQELRGQVPRPGAWFANLQGEGGNAMAIIASVNQALRHDDQRALVKEFTELAMSGSYEELLATVDEFVIPFMGDPPRPVDSLLDFHRDLQRQVEADHAYDD